MKEERESSEEDWELKSCRCSEGDMGRIGAEEYFVHCKYNRKHTRVRQEGRRVIQTPWRWIETLLDIVLLTDLSNFFVHTTKQVRIQHTKTILS